MRQMQQTASETAVVDPSDGASSVLWGQRYSTEPIDLHVEAHGSVKLMMDFLKELRMGTCVRVARVAGDHIWIEINELIGIEEFLHDIDGVASVELGARGFHVVLAGNGIATTGAAEKRLKMERRALAGRSTEIEAERAGQESPIDAKKILVVDDSNGIRDFLSALLRANGYRCTTTDSGEKALAMLDTATFDAVLCDIMMSGISGFQVLKEVKRRDPQTVVIMISGLPLSPGVVESIEKEGAFGYVQKPFYEDHLKSTLRKALKLEEARDQVCQ